VTPTRPAPGGRRQPDLFPPRLPWAAALIDAADGPVPGYGSPAWAALPDNSPAKVAAAVIAAESWRTYWAPEEHARRLATELAAAHAAEQDAHWSGEVVAAVHRSARRPRYSQLCERRGEPQRAERARQHERRMGLVPVV
jgi:hypothetical protein